MDLGIESRNIIAVCGSWENILYGCTVWLLWCDMHRVDSYLDARHDLCFVYVCKGGESFKSSYVCIQKINWYC